MKKIFYSLATLAMTASLFSCDNIAEGDRLIYVAPSEVSKNVLIEDFTGQGCINCPEAADAIHELQEVYGKSQVIAVGLYSGDYGKKKDGTLYPLTTETGNHYYYDVWNVPSQPYMYIDRKESTVVSGILQDYVTKYLKETTSVTLIPSVSYDATSKTAKVNVDVASSETIANAKLQVWVIEDSIVDWQLMKGNKVNKTYVHNHVFRTTVTDRDGKAITLDANKQVTETLSVAIDDSWVAKNLSIVAFVFNDEGVKQTEIIPLVSE